MQNSHTHIWKHTLGYYTYKQH